MAIGFLSDESEQSGTWRQGAPAQTRGALFPSFQTPFQTSRPRIEALARDAPKERRLHELRETGATGLEPATSGVTDRYTLNRHGRLPPRFTGWSRHFVPAPTGCDRLRSAATRQGLCSTCVVELVSG